MKWLKITALFFLVFVIGYVGFRFWYLPADAYRIANDYEKDCNIFSAVDAYQKIINFRDSRKKVEDYSSFLFDPTYIIQFGLSARINDKKTATITFIDSQAKDKQEEIDELLKNTDYVKQVGYIPIGFDKEIGYSFFILQDNGFVKHTIFNKTTNDFQNTHEKIKDYVEDDWTNIKKISCSMEHIVGLKNNGTVVAAGQNQNEQCNVDDWAGIVDVSAGGYFTVGLKENGKVTIAVSKTKEYSSSSDPFVTELINISSRFEKINTWTDIEKISSGYRHIVGLTKKGKVVAVGENQYGQCNVDAWTDVTNVCATEYATYALKEDGTILTTKRPFSLWLMRS